MKKSFILSSIMILVLCLSLISGATFALFTSESTNTISVSAGKVEVVTALSDLKTYSMDVEQQQGYFENGGTAVLDAVAGTVVLEKVTPGDKATFKLVVTNNSNVSIKYSIKYTVTGELAAGLNITETENSVENDIVSQLSPEWTKVTASGQLHEKLITIELPVEAGNEYQEKAAEVQITVYAVQANDPTWAGEADTAWYNDTDKEFTISTAAELQGLSKLVNAGNNFKGKTVKLGADIDLATTYNLYELQPIGKSGLPFSGTFDGQGHTISNLKMTNNSNKSYVGLFGHTTLGEIKNLIINNAEVKGYTSVGTVSGNPYTSKYTNIQVTGLVKVEGLSYVGGVGGRNAYANWDQITVDVEDGSYVKAVSTENGKMYRTYVGGVVGFMGEGSHTMSNVQSNIDVFGDVCDVGGIVGIAHYGNNFANITCTGNVTLHNPNGYEDSPVDSLEIGGIAGVWHNNGNVTLSNCVFTGELSATYDIDGVTYEVTDFRNNGLVGKAYNDNGNGVLKIDNQEYVAKTAASITDVKALLNAAKTSGQAIEIDCGGANLGSATYTDFAANSVIKNATFEATRWSRTFGDVTFVGCTFKNSVYAFHFDSGKGEITAIDCTFEGWCPIASTIEKVTLVNCTIKGSGSYGAFRFYQDAELINCTIDCSNTNHTDGFPDGISAIGSTVTLTDCNLVYCTYEVADGGKVISNGVVVAE